MANDHVIEPSSPASASIDDPQSDPDPVNAIHLCTNYMLALLSDVLDVGRFENGAVKLEIRTVDLHAVLGGVTAMAKARALAKGLQFRAEVGLQQPNGRYRVRELTFFFVSRRFRRWSLDGWNATRFAFSKSLTTCFRTGEQGIGAHFRNKTQR